MRATGTGGAVAAAAAARSAGVRFGTGLVRDFFGLRLAGIRASSLGGSRGSRPAASGDRRWRSYGFAGQLPHGDHG